MRNASIAQCMKKTLTQQGDKIRRTAATGPRRRDIHRHFALKCRTIGRLQIAGRRHHLGWIKGLTGSPSTICAAPL
ncbi:hypothetical protein Q4543_04585 [Salipiger sp. 1_MG-2023]|uniref:hypothetical protein n=1 Tax=Salipiger sp. 1_MG-2023 TaxID=3062665 RepID=UPI0026E473CE|nr:hypothetical protein [Salipiger sp. 1_MG-2023]MDO6584790.1 hypothetical protein [Salipiger sp. 1_MG-2023]